LTGERRFTVRFDTAHAHGRGRHPGGGTACRVGRRTSMAPYCRPWYPMLDNLTPATASSDSTFHGWGDSCSNTPTARSRSRHTLVTAAFAAASAVSAQRCVFLAMPRAVRRTRRNNCPTTASELRASVRRHAYSDTHANSTFSACRCELWRDIACPWRSRATTVTRPIFRASPVRAERSVSECSVTSDPVASLPLRLRATYTRASRHDHRNLPPAGCSALVWRWPRSCEPVR